jgi:hypothetical protein
MAAKLKGFELLWADNQKYFSRFVKISVSVLSIGFLCYKIIEHGPLNDFGDSLRALDLHAALIALAAIALALPNWLLESAKWKLLVRKIQPVGTAFAIKSIFAGMAFSILTPNRMGEIPGRTVFLPKQHRKKALVATALGGAGQMWVTVLIGICSWCYLSSKHNFMGPEFTLGPMLISMVVLACLTTLSIVFFSAKAPFLKKLMQTLKPYKAGEMCLVLFLSLARYAIFITQFYLFLLVFDVNIHFQQAYPSIALTYLIMYLTPFLSIADLGVRGSSAILCIGFFSTQVTGIVLAGFALWLLNVVIPSVCGSFTVHMFKAK